MADGVKSKAAKKSSGTASNGLSDHHLGWYEVMLRIRRFEERALMMYSKNKIRGFLHVYIGQEAIAGAMTTAIRKEDPVVTAYRQHGTAICRGIETKYCMAELFGKKTGINKGKGGSMHFFSKEHYYFGGNGIVGAQIPIGTGIALAEKYKETGNIGLTMFGDGAARQGALHESFNMAMTWELPVLYICENNHYAMGTSTKRTSNVQDIYTIGEAYNMPSSAVDGMNVEKVHQALFEAAEHVRSGKGPYFLEIKTYRYRGHSVSDPAKYRSKEELESYKEKDPIAQLGVRMLDSGKVKQEELDKIDEMIKAEIDEAVEFAEASDFPDPSELYTDNYVQPDYPFLT
jgi:pyruvate dehydrogenase E1 component alpha subunit